MVFEGEVVWPSLHGSVRGEALVPLVADAPEVAEENPELYRLLTLIDSLRVGRARERNLAASMLRGRLEEASS